MNLVLKFLYSNISNDAPLVILIYEEFTLYK